MTFFYTTLRAYSGKDGSELWNHKHRDVGTVSGLSVAPWRDGDGDGIQNVLVGTCHWHCTGKVFAGGSVRLLSEETGRELREVYALDCIETRRA